jgi:hypothetical protein
MLRSSGANLCFFKDVPNVASNQHFEKPIRPNTLATKNKNIVNVGESSNKPQNI